MLRSLLYQSLHPMGFNLSFVKLILWIDND